MIKKTFKIEGLSCGHCEKRVVLALSEIGVKAKASSKKGLIELCYDDNISENSIIESINEAGYKLII